MIVSILESRFLLLHLAQEFSLNSLTILHIYWMPHRLQRVPETEGPSCGPGPCWLQCSCRLP
jgi:hypothetical protein